jgi:hypothetical protein
MNASSFPIMCGQIGLIILCLRCSDLCSIAGLAPSMDKKVFVQLDCRANNCTQRKAFFRAGVMFLYTLSVFKGCSNFQVVSKSENHPSRQLW